MQNDTNCCKEDSGEIIKLKIAHVYYLSIKRFIQKIYLSRFIIFELINPKIPPPIIHSNPWLEKTKPNAPIHKPKNITCKIIFPVLSEWAFDKPEETALVISFSKSLRGSDPQKGQTKPPLGISILHWKHCDIDDAPIDNLKFSISQVYWQALF